ncbi:MAG: rhomboid family intramembrane serine protease [Planctomycetia bacterium]|nr:rhomboid family intramembrane serine protease [Planctomycetia bacterium]
MLPLRDNIPPRTFPVVNYLIIAVCGLVFLAQLADSHDGQDEIVETFGMIPVRVYHPDATIPVEEAVLVRTQDGIEKRTIERELPPLKFSPWITLLTCTFLHGGWMHFLGNMWFLHIFGDNVEDRFGHFGYVLFYLGCGIAASAAHLVLNASPTVPTIGASGAIAGVMGAYLYLYPRAHVEALVPIVFFIQIMVVPAPLFLIIWFAMQFFQGTFSITSSESGGVAWWAHVGGFAAGFIIAWLLDRGHRLSPPVEVLRPNTQRPTVYRYGRSPTIYDG